MNGFWAGRRVLVTGHTGFKGAWLSFWLDQMGAGVSGLALAPDTAPALFDQLGLASKMDHGLVDVRDPNAVRAQVETVQPDIVFHLAAQPLVLRGYAAPVETWDTNVGGTLHLLDALGKAARPVTLVIVTTDKVYENREWDHPYREADRLGGRDPYSASKAATELLAASWRDSFGGDLRIATARAGNVIGGGDWAENRIVPDVIRSLNAGNPVSLRNPEAVRPWQHVLEPLAGYLRLAERLHGDAALARAWNFGPAPGDFRSVQELADAMLSKWPGSWEDVSGGAVPHEAGRLAVASDLARQRLDWAPRWSFAEAVEKTVAWYRAMLGGSDPVALTQDQIAEYGAP
ncbi:CDP-glucose 4,6-dehydratase [Defluviimonas sp. 20V17]|nr:CDP-glucose 4,6-dehydratase [Defluviimonas sp. 20V17]SDW75012.1 CDP-glucose 4,6-dehydratase [Allgaiera indica]